MVPPSAVAPGEHLPPRLATGRSPSAAAAARVPRQSAHAGRTVAVVLGAGQGTRMGAERNKVFLPLGGTPILAHAIGAFERCLEIDDILLVAHPHELAECRDLARRYELHKVRQIVAGGATRHASESCALAALRGSIERGEIGLVLVHDGARPFVTQRDLRRLLAAVRRDGAAVLATPLRPDETLADVDGSGQVAMVYPAARLWRAQTPQAFGAAALLAAYDAAARDGFEGTDTAASLERAGHAVTIVAGSPHNVKITTPSDLARAEGLLARWRG